jgi:hypothetical protein
VTHGDEDWLGGLLRPAPPDEPTTPEPEPANPPNVQPGVRQPGPGDLGEQWFRGVLGLDPTDKSRIE